MLPHSVDYTTNELGKAIVLQGQLKVALLKLALLPLEYKILHSSHLSNLSIFCLDVAKSM